MRRRLRPGRRLRWWLRQVWHGLRVAAFTLLWAVTFPLMTLIGLIEGSTGWEHVRPRAVHRSYHRSRQTFLFITKRSRHVGPVALRGTHQFVRQTMKALALLRRKAPEAAHLIDRYLMGIYLAPIDFPGAWVQAYRFGGICWVGRPLVKRSSIRYFAGVLAHEAYHCKLKHTHHRGWRRWIAPVPIEAYSGETGERKCLEYQCGVLREVGFDAPSVERFKRRMLRTRWWEKHQLV